VKTWHGVVPAAKLNQTGPPEPGMMKLLIQAMILTIQDIKVELVTLHKLFGKTPKDLAVVNTKTT